MPLSAPPLLFLIPILVPLLLVFSILNAVSDFISRMTELPTPEEENMRPLKNENVQPSDDVEFKIKGSFLNSAMSEALNLTTSETAALTTSEGVKFTPSEGAPIGKSEGVNDGFWEKVRVPTPEAANSNEVPDKSRFSNSKFCECSYIHDDEDVSEINGLFIDFDDPKDENLPTKSNQTSKLDDLEQAQAFLKAKNVELLSSIKSLEQAHSNKLSSFLAEEQLWNDKLSLLAQSHTKKMKAYEADEEVWNCRLKALVMEHYHSRRSHEEDERVWKAKASSADQEKMVLSLQTQQQAMEEKLESPSTTYDRNLASLRAEEQTLQGKVYSLSTAYDSKIAELAQKEKDIYCREEENLWCLDRLSNARYPTPLENATCADNSAPEDPPPKHFAQNKEPSSDLFEEKSSSPISVSSFLSQPPPNFEQVWGQPDTEDHDLFVKLPEIEKEVEKEYRVKETRLKLDQFKTEAAWKNVVLEPQTWRGKGAILMTEELRRLLQDFLPQRRVVIGAQQYRHVAKVPQFPCMNEPSEKGELDETAQAPKASQCGSPSATNDDSAHKSDSRSVQQRHALKKKKNAHIKRIEQAKQLEESINFTILEKMAKLKESGETLVGVKLENGQIVIGTNLLLAFTWAPLEIDRLERFLDLRGQIDKFEAEQKRKAAARKERLSTKEAVTEDTESIDVEDDYQTNSEFSFGSSTSGAMSLPAPVHDVATRTFSIDSSPSGGMPLPPVPPATSSRQEFRPNATPPRGPRSSVPIYAQQYQRPQSRAPPQPLGVSASIWAPGNQRSTLNQKGKQPARVTSQPWKNYRPKD